MDIETALAQASLDRVKRRDPANVYHQMTTEELADAGARLRLERVLRRHRRARLHRGQRRLAGLLQGRRASSSTSASLDDWKTYLRWHAVHDAAPLLPAAFVDENFDFFGKTLTRRQGAAAALEALRGRSPTAQLGEALGQLYVEKTFGAEGKARMAKMVAALEAALRQRHPRACPG